MTRYLVDEIYRYAYEEVVLNQSADAFSFCTCHSLSFRTEAVLTVLQQLTHRFPAKSNSLSCAIIAPGKLLQEYLLCMLLQKAFAYKELNIYIIDLEYEDPQFGAERTDIVSKIPKALSKKLKDKPLSELLRSEHRLALLRDAQVEIVERHAERLKKLLNGDGFSAQVHYFRHVHGFLDWGKNQKLGLHLLLMVDPYPIDSIIEMPDVGSGVAFDDTYPLFSNLLLLKDTESLAVQYLAFRHALPNIPLVWYQRSPAWYLQSKNPRPTVVAKTVQEIITQAGKESQKPTPWSLIFTEIEKSEQIAHLLCSEPYTAFDDMAFTLLRADGIAYQSQMEAGEEEGEEAVPHAIGIPGAAKVPDFYTFIIDKERHRIASGLPVQRMQEVLTRLGFEQM